jgi:hypothetical protein
MAPLQAYQHNSATHMPSLKNTFLHVESSDDLDLDDCTWVVRRQASEPTPMKRQLSTQPMVRAAPQLGSLDENEFEEQVDENDKIADAFDVSNVFIRPGSCIKRQISASLELGTDMERQISSLSQSGFDRQMSTLSAHGLDRQVSCLSAAGFTRQLTEQVWPTYQNRETKDLVVIPDSPVHDAHHQVADSAPESYCVDPVSHVQDQESAEATEQAFGNCEVPMVMPMNQLMMAYAMNPMMWQGMQSNVPTTPTTEMAETNAGNPSLSTLQGKSRRKARSLVTMAQEAQRQRQLEWQQQLEQQIKGSLGMQFSQAVTESQVAPVASHEEAPTTEQAVEATASVSEDIPKKVMNFCGHCGGSIKGHFKFCQFCGKPVV